MQTFKYQDFIGRLGVDDKELKDFLAISRIKLDWQESPWIAGGALRRTINGEKLDSDFDLFFTGNKVFNETIDTLADSGFSIEAKRETETAVWFESNTYKINLIKLFYDTPESLIDSFDYTICQVVSDMKTIGFGDFTLWDMGRKRLVIHKITYPIASMRRMIKYAKQGYYACPGTMQEFLQRVSQTPDLIGSTWNYID